MAKAKVDDNILSIDLGYSGVKYYFKRKGKESCEHWFN